MSVGQNDKQRHGGFRDYTAPTFVVPVGALIATVVMFWTAGRDVSGMLTTVARMDQRLEHIEVAVNEIRNHRPTREEMKLAIQNAVTDATAKLDIRIRELETNGN